MRWILGLISLMFAFFCVQSAFAQNAVFFGTFHIDITVGNPICEETTQQIVFGSDFSKRAEPLYFYIPADATEETYSFTKDDGDEFTRTIRIIDEYTIDVYQVKTTASYSTTIDLTFAYTNNYQEFTATGVETGGSDCQGPTTYQGVKISSDSDGGCELGEPILYDAFSDDHIDGNRWRQREYVREIVNGEFLSKLGNRSPGMDAEIGPGVFRNHLPFADPDTVNAIECDMTVEEALPDRAPGSRSGGMILGYFYNSNESGGATGDIFAYLMIGKRSGGSDLEAFWAVLEVKADDTSVKSVLGSGTIDGFDPTVMNSPYKAKVAYDNNRTFVFAVGPHTQFYVGPQKMRGAVTKLKSLSTGINAVKGGNDGYVSAKFDNVYINDEITAYDDFSSDRIDLSKWLYSEWIREQKNGYLRAEIPGYGRTRTVNTHLIEKDAPYFEAKVLIDSQTQLSPGANCVSRIQGYYYNDSRGPGSGQEYNRYEGDIFVQVRLYYDSYGTLSANAYVHRCNDENESSFTELFSHNFSIPIALDTYYTLSICYKDNKLVFGCNGETAVYTIVSSVYPAYGEHRLLRSRIYLDSEEYGFVKARFDDVFILEKAKYFPSIPLLLLTE